ncbi:MAG: GIY-YIG nuclease family protein [Stygiobacter sp.]|jgi:putative endonuclease|uniref:GIY-YIG nuclease family protein n=1 Tax=Stygiobacter electus TaxID=3032292 RepID=A0AAE3TCQ6_9BACT|nr:GIY-YIG nuclease family protein [Stygiobacter electus]MDF1612180.1 GIY-YIG nuclease family protein [Stygiobacter electus]
MKSYYVYILKCNDGSYYTGVTSNLEKRILGHNSGTFDGYTSTRLPVELVYSNELQDMNEAI